MEMKLNHYHLVLKNPSNFILMEADIPFTRQKELRKTVATWAGIKNAHLLEIYRGRRYQTYIKQVVSSNQDFRWEKRGPVLWGGYHFSY